MFLLQPNIYLPLIRLAFQWKGRRFAIMSSYPPHHHTIPSSHARSITRLRSRRVDAVSEIRKRTCAHLFRHGPPEHQLTHRRLLWFKWATSSRLSSNGDPQKEEVLRNMNLKWWALACPKFIGETESYDMISTFMVNPLLNAQWINFSLRHFTIFITAFIVKLNVQNTSFLLMPLPTLVSGIVLSGRATTDQTAVWHHSTQGAHSGPRPCPGQWWVNSSNLGIVNHYSSKLRIVNHYSSKGITLLINCLGFGVDPTLSLVSEEEASVAPPARRQSAGEHELADHPLLATQFLWLVKSENLAEWILSARLSGFQLLSIAVFRQWSLLNTIWINYAVSPDLVQCAAQGYGHQVGVHRIMIFVVLIGEGDFPGGVESQPVGEVGILLFNPVFSSLTEVWDANLQLYFKVQFFKWHFWVYLHNMTWEDLS